MPACHHAAVCCCAVHAGKYCTLLTLLSRRRACCRTYRFLYILNWVYRYFTDPNYESWIGVASLCLLCFMSLIV